MGRAKRVAILAVLVFTSAIAKDIKIVKTFTPLCNELLDVEIEGNLMIVPGGLGGAVVFNISNPSDPVTLSTIMVSGFDWGRTYNWDIENGIAVATSREDGAAIVNIDRPDNPHVLHILDPDEEDVGRSGTPFISLEDVEIHGDYALFAAHIDGLLIYDIDYPTTPVLVSRIESEDAWSLAIHDNIAYVADGDGGIFLVDISNPVEPTVLSTHSVEGSIQDIRYHDGLIFTASGSKGVDVFDVGDPMNPIHLTNHQTGGFATRVTVHGDGQLVSVAAWDFVEVLHWNGASLSLEGFKNTGGRVMAVGSPGGNIVYSAEWTLFHVMEFGPVSDPDIDISTYHLNYNQLDEGQSETRNLTVTNNGGSTLQFLNLESTHDDFTFSPHPGWLNAGESVDLAITYTANEPKATGKFTIATNDPDEDWLYVRLDGNTPYGVDIGMEAPDFTIPVVANGAGSFDIRSLRGRIVVMSFLASW